VTAAGFDDRRASFTGGGPGFGTQISLADYGAFKAGAKPRGVFGAFPANTTDIETGVAFDPPKPCLIDCRTSFPQGPGGDNRYAYLQGTSMATGRVAGIVALVKGFNPDLTADDVIRLMKETARGTTYSTDLGWGIVDAGAAVAAARKLDRTPPTSFLSAPRRTGERKFTISWTGNDPARPGLVPSGLRRFEVYTSRNGGAYKRVKSTKASSIRFTGSKGARYSFFTVAIDRAGNKEPRPLRADASTRVSR
jgi:subtilisin family serine protease